MDASTTPVVILAFANDQDAYLQMIVKERKAIAKALQDRDAYREPSGEFFANLLAKAGQSTIFEGLFARQANDIAVGVESILGVAGPRAIAPVRRNVACHHLNYFASDAGQAALTEVKW